MKERSTFDPDFQETHMSSKIIVGLQRISEAFKVLLWDKAKQLGLSPIQIQLLIFIAYHKPEFCNVSYLAKEFNLTKPTISDAIKVLYKKELIYKDFATIDSRSYLVRLTEQGKKIVSETEDFATPIQKQVEKISQQDLVLLFGTLSKLIYQLNKNNILTVQRTCYGCKFYNTNNNQHYCNLLQKPLHNSEIKLDCPDFEQKV